MKRVLVVRVRNISNVMVALVKVAVGIVFNAHGQVLIAERPAEKSHSGLWEFPGGKIETNETVFCA